MPTHPVSGQVRYGGKPAEGVQVYLLPTSAPTVPQIPANPRGVTGADGRFSLGTYAAADGAAEGGYQVILLWPHKASPDDEVATDRLLGWYDGVNSKLTTRVVAGANTLPPIQLPVVTRPPEQAAGVPGRN
ncbi:MAG: hypothetical protein U0736_25925 [Gemmataceae bacterium]